MVQYLAPPVCSSWCTRCCFTVSIFGPFTVFGVLYEKLRDSWSHVGSLISAGCMSAELMSADPQAGLTCWFRVAEELVEFTNLICWNVFIYLFFKRQLEPQSWAFPSSLLSCFSPVVTFWFIIIGADDPFKKWQFSLDPLTLVWSALLQVFAFNKYYSYILFTIVQVQFWTATCSSSCCLLYILLFN